VSQITATSQPSETDVVFALGMKSGAATTLALAHIYGWDNAADSIDRDLQSSLSEDEMSILADAIRLIVAQRHTAPDDLSTLPAVPATPCRDSACRICRPDSEVAA
jgi:hypothetical protein